MTGRQKIEAAFSPDGTPEIAVVIPYEGIYVRDHWSELTRCPWWWAHEPSIERQLRFREEIQQSINQDWISLPSFLPAEARKHIRIETRADGVYRIDDRKGSKKKLSPPVVSGTDHAGVAAPYNPKKLFETTEEIDAAIAIPSADSKADSGPGRDDLAKALLAGPASGLYPTGQVNSPMWLCYGVWGFEGLMMTIATNPDLVHYACERFMSSMSYRVRELAALGVRGVWIEECLTDQISPDAFASLNVPIMQRLVREIRDAEMHSIYYFSGNPKGKWDHILSIGADALSLEESKKGFEIDIEEVAERINGRCVLLGNLDAIGILQNGSDDQLRHEIARQIAAGRKNGSRFIMSLGSPVTPETPVSRVRTYCEMARAEL